MRFHLQHSKVRQPWPRLAGILVFSVLMAWPHTSLAQAPAEKPPERPPEPAATTPQTAPQATAKPVAVRLGSLQRMSPASWIPQKPSNLLRSYQFQIPGTNAEERPGEVAIYKEASPKVEQKFAEWKSTFVPPAEGESGESAVRTDRFTVGMATAHTLDVQGTWKYRERPRDPRSKEELRPGSRVLWVILVEKDETTHLRLSGPKSLVDRHAPEFLRWIQSAP